LNDNRYHWETTFIVNASLDDSQIEGVVAKVQDVLTKNRCDVLGVQRWGRKRLAFPIGKKNNGFYVCIEFRGPADTVAKLEKFYQLEENILRHLTVHLTRQILAARSASSAIEVGKGESTPAAHVQEPATTESPPAP
jgi:small subunit ribosomal protein S6